MEQVQQQHNPLDEVQHFFIKRSLSQQDILGRTNNFPQADMERHNPGSGVNNTVKTLNEDSSMAPTGRMPFPPVPKVEQLPTSLPSLPSGSVQQAQLSSYPTTGSQVMEISSLISEGRPI